MALPTPPLDARPLAVPLQARAGDHGVALAFHLYDSTGGGGFYYLPSGATVALIATEQREAPTRERRAPRTFTGACAIDGTDASLVSYVLQTGDAALGGTFALALAVTFQSGEVITWPSSNESPAGLVLEIV